MRTDAEWGFVSESEQALIRRLRAEVGQAVSDGRPIRLVLKGGEVLEGIPHCIRVNVSSRPGSGNSPLAVEEHGLFGPAEVVVELAGTAVLAQEVEDFAVLPD